MDVTDKTKVGRTPRSSPSPPAHARMASVDLLKSALSLWKLETGGWKWVVGVEPRVYARLQDELLGCNDLLKEFQIWVPCQRRDCRVVSEFCRCGLEHDGCCDQGRVRSSTQEIHREYSFVIAGLPGVYT